jgi:hypothetical protein
LDTIQYQTNAVFITGVHPSALCNTTLVKGTC